jgi:uncharacterized membrane protein
MPDIGTFGPYHPHTVHFVVALAILGVVLRWISLLGRVPFTGPAAATLILLSAVASVVAVQSGIEAHGPAEAPPGARAAVIEHEEWGIRTRNALLGVALLEIVALVLARRRRADVEGARRAPRILHFASALAGLGALFCLYEAGEHGGEVVYAYAGGVGLQRNDPADVGRLLMAGLYHQAQLDRKAGRGDDAAALIEMAARRFPDDLEVRLLRADSQLRDRKDAAGATAMLDAITVPGDNTRMRVRHTILRADALVAGGQRDAAKSAVEALLKEFPNDARLKRKAEELAKS